MHSPYHKSITSSSLETRKSVAFSSYTPNYSHNCTNNNDASIFLMHICTLGNIKLIGYINDRKFNAPAIIVVV